VTWTPLPGTVQLTITNPEPVPYILDPAKTALVVVDMQYSVVKDPSPVDSQVHKRLSSLERHRSCVPGIQTLLAKARTASAKVLYVESLRLPESPDHTVFKGDLHLQQGTDDVEMIKEIAPIAGETVIPKWSNDVFSWWGMEAALDREGVTPGEWTVLVTGISAAACAEAAALGFANRKYRTLIPLDATAASPEAESRIFALYQEPDYANRMGFTLSTLVEFAPAAAKQAAVDDEPVPAGV
jgi:nicotinamidase-related amidase